MIKLKCEKCKQFKEDVELRIDIYQHDINDNLDEELLCLDCYEDLLGDI